MVRIKHRYLLVNFLYPTEQSRSSKGDLPDVVLFNQPSSDELTIQYLTRLIRTNVAEMYGDYGAGAISTSLQVKYLSPATSTAIIRAPRNHYRLVWAALSFTTQLPAPIGQPCVIRVVRVSGTIRKAEDEAIRRAKDLVMRAVKYETTGVDGLLDQLAPNLGQQPSDMEGIEDEDSQEEDVDLDDAGDDEEDGDEDLGEAVAR